MFPLILLRDKVNINRLKTSLHDQNVPSKTWSKNFDGFWLNRNPSYFSKKFDGLRWELTNQNIFSE